jgi:hypothetical protein
MSAMQPSEVSSTDWPNMLLNAATFIAAITAVYFSHRSLKLNTRQRIAEFRKEWLESLRADVAQLLTHDSLMHNCFVQLNDLKNAKKGAEGTEMEKTFTDQAIQVIHAREKAIADRHSAFGSILLKINDEKGVNGDFVNAIHNLLKSETLKDSAAARDVLINSSRILFRDEWEKIKHELEHA